MCSDFRIVKPVLENNTFSSIIFWDAVGVTHEETVYQESLSLNDEIKNKTSQQIKKRGNDVSRLNYEFIFLGDERLKLR